MSRLLLAVLVLIGLSTSSLAQRPVPILLHSFPAGGQLGESVELAIGGNHLEGVTSLWFDHPGLRAFHLKGLTYKVVIAPGTPIGHHDLRVIGPFGISNPKTFVVGSQREVVEVEPNNMGTTPQPIDINTTVNGRIVPTDVDVYTFLGKKDQRILIDLEAERLYSKLDATLRLTYADGRFVAESRDADGIDPFLDVVLPADGWYHLTVHDVIYGGSPEHVYRLAIHDGPHVLSVSPPMAIPGVETEFTLWGQNLGGMLDPKVLVDRQPLERATWKWTLPVTNPVGASEPRTAVASSQASRRGSEVSYPGNRGRSNLFFVAEAVSPVVTEHEPNDLSPQDVTVPCDVAGLFDHPGDLDLYRFEVKSRDTIVFESFADRIGSPAEPRFVLQKIDDKGNLTDIASGASAQTEPIQPTFPLRTTDEIYRWVNPELGRYQLQVYDQYGTGRGDLRLFYQLSLRNDRPDFRVFAVPPSANPSAIPNLVRRGGRSAIHLLASRSDGFTGPISVEAIDLPPGLTCHPVVLGAGQSSGVIVLEAGSTTLESEFCIGLIARTRFAGSPDGPDLVRQVVIGELTVPPLFSPPPPPQQPAQPPIPARVVRGLVGAVRDQARFAIKTGPAKLVIAEGSYARADVTIERMSGFAEPMSLSSMTQLMAPVVLAKEESSTVVSVLFPKGMVPGPRSLILEASGPILVEKGTTGAEKVQIQASEVSEPLTVLIRPAAVELTLEVPKEGATVGSQVEIPFKVVRQNGYTGPVTLSLAPGPNPKARFEPVILAAGMDSGKIQFVLDADFPIPPAPPALAKGTPVPPPSGLYLRAIAVVNDEQLVHDVPLALTIRKK